MARTAIKAEDLKDSTIEDMKILGVYKPQYNQIINIYVDLCVQYNTAMKEFKKSGYKYETETAAGGTKKSAIAATLETLRKDLLAYSDRLCLNPKALQSVTPDKPINNTDSKLSSASREFNRRKIE